MIETMSHAVRTGSIAVAAAIVAVIGALTIAGAWYFEFVLKYLPCPLCYQQRIAYYVAIPLAVLVVLAARKAPRGLLVAALAVIALAMLANAALGVYHAGIEWKWWAGPSDCTGPLTGLGSAGSLLRDIDNEIVVRCDEAAWRFLGLSLAGYNAIISLALAAVAAWGIKAAIRE
jgi:disulfide bond formation protein DsbB